MASVRSDQSATWNAEGAVGPSRWILAEGIWSDIGRWRDDATWQDSQGIPVYADVHASWNAVEAVVVDFSVRWAFGDYFYGDGIDEFSFVVTAVDRKYTISGYRKYAIRGYKKYTIKG